MVNTLSHVSFAGPRPRATGLVASTFLLMIGVDYALADSPPATPPKLFLSESIVAGCQSLIGRLQLANPAPAGGRLVSISDTLAAAITPTSVTVPEGETTQTFVISTTPVRTTQSGTITARFGAALRTRNLSVRPIGMLSVALAPTKVVGANSIDATAKLECKAGPGPITVELASSDAGIANPVAANIVVPQGLQSMHFDVATAQVFSTASASISGTANGIKKSRILTVTPASFVSPTSLLFGAVPLGTTGGPRAATVTNRGKTSFTIGSIAITGRNPLSFVMTENCPAILAAGASCLVKVTFKPTEAGSRLATLSIATSARAVPLTVELSGTGGGSYGVIHAFGGGAEGRDPLDGVIRDAAGNLYGTTSRGGDLACLSGGCGTVFMVDASGNLLTLHTFSGSPTDGAGPSGPLTRGAAGNLYGTTSSGGKTGYGTVFRLDAAGNETVLHHFTGGDGGAAPRGGVLRDSVGNLYGVTMSGGLDCLVYRSNGCGTVFRLAPDGTFTTLHRFAADGTEGGQPQTGLIADAAGNLYGVNSASTTPDHRGTVFRIDSAGVFTTLHHFGTSDLGRPGGPLMRDAAGNLYGVAATGGAEGGGTIYRLDSEGEISILHEFALTDRYDGWPYSTEPGGTAPNGRLVGDPSGIVYGTTLSGGVDRVGIVFRFDMRSRALVVLHTFTRAQAGGIRIDPYAGTILVRDSGGVLYGTTPRGGDLTCNPPYGCGTVFRIN
jgi:uncharacterized repeat protein (TIGR03803 family)